MNILAIETSCDETSVAIVADGQRVLQNLVSSQIDLHSKYGGVVPEVASRAHAEVLNILLQEALDGAKLSWSEISAIAVTVGPGLIGALLIGLAAAKTIAYTKNIPFIAVNHIEGHVFANFLDNDKFSIESLPFPFMSLVVSGGHTQIMWMPEADKYEIVARTTDDSVGEAFDKVARILELGYPGGPVIDRIAKSGNSQAIPFPKLYNDHTLDFSFSGIKTAVLRWVQKNGKANVADIAASFQRISVEYLIENTLRAARQKKCSLIFLAGGVSANSLLRSQLKEKAALEQIEVYAPPLKYCTDNAAMIAAAAYPKLLQKKYSPLSVEAEPSLAL